MKKKKSDEDSSKEEEDSSEEESGGGKVEYDIKKSNSCYAYDKKKKKLLQEMVQDGLVVQLEKNHVKNFQ